MKLLITGDWHLRLKNPRARKDNFFEAQTEKVKWILSLYHDKKLDAILQPGDMFDTGRPSFYLIQYYIKLLRERANPPIYTIYGQHDMYLHSEFAKDRTASKVLESAGLVNIVGNKACIMNEWTNPVDLYGASYGQEVPEVSDPKHYNILMIHKMILTEQLWADQTGHEYASSFLRRYKDFNLIVSGDYHYPFFFSKGGRIILNGGCIVRKTIAKNDLALKPVVYILDTDTDEIETHEIPIRPVEEIFDMTSVNTDSKAENAVLDKFTNKLSVDSGKFSFSFKDNIEQFVQDNGISLDVREIISECLLTQK